MAKKPCFFLRVPHYISSWLRHCDHDNPIPLGAPVIIDRGSYLSTLFTQLACPNLDNTVQPDCFSQKQWDSMCKGNMLVSHDDEMRMSVQRDPKQPLQMHEILLSLDKEKTIQRDYSSGRPEPDSAYFYVYQPFQMPDIVIQNNRERLVQSDWYMPDPKPFVNELHKLYKLAINKFITDDQEYCNLHLIKRPVTQSIKKFLQWYDISDGDKEMLQTRQMLRRMKERYLLSLGPSAANSDLDTECLHECHTPTDRAAIIQPDVPANAPRRIFCPELNRTFRSIRDAARITHISESTLRYAVKMRTATHRLHFLRDSDFDRNTSRNR